MLGNREGRAPHSFPTISPFLPTPSQLHESKISFSKATLWNIKQSSICFSKRSTTPCKAPNAQHPSSLPHLLGQGAPVGHDAQTAIQLPDPEPQAAPIAYSSLSFFLKAISTHSATKCKLQPVLLYMQFALGVNWLLKAKENQLSLAAKGEVMLCFQLYNLLLLKLSVPYEPAALSLPFPQRNSRPTPQPTLP